jgi:calmodulin
VASDGQESIDFHDFLKFPARKIKDVDIEEEFIQAFKIFDKDNRGKIDFDKIRCVFINLDEKINEEEIVEIIRKAKVNDDGTVDYRDFIKDLMNE